MSHLLSHVGAAKTATDTNFFVRFFKDKSLQEQVDVCMGKALTHLNRVQR